MNNFPEPQYADANGVKLAYYEGESPVDDARPPILLVHGWPEIAYSWKNQLHALTEAGWRAIAIDVKGFGRSDAPRDKSLYDIAHLTDDLAGFLDALSIDKAVFCGHDWGGAQVWPMAQRHPDRVAGIIGVSTPHRPPPPVSPLTIIEKRFTDRHYFIQFQKEGRPEEILGRDPDAFFRLMFRRPVRLAPGADIDIRIYDLLGRLEHGPQANDSDVLLADDDIKVYADAYRHSGFHGGVNLYRNIDNNWRIMKNFDPIIQHEALWVGAALDVFLPPDGADDLSTFVPNVEKHLIEECGHWVMWEKPAELNAILIDWLNRKMRN